MNFKIGAAFGASGGGLAFTVTTSAGDELAAGTARNSGACTATIAGNPGDDVYFVLSDGREAGPVILDNAVSDAIEAVNAIEIGTGTGARTITFTVQDANSIPIERATIRVTAGLITKRDVTDVYGAVEIPVNDGTWHFAIDKSGYDGVTGTRVVAGDLAIAATLSAVVVPLPADPGLVTVYGAYGFLNVYEADIPVMGSIKGNGNVFLSNTLQNTDRTASTTTGAGGIWSLDLAPLPNGFFWELSIGSKKLKIAVPDAPNTTLDVETLIVGG